MEEKVILRFNYKNLANEAHVSFHEELIKIIANHNPAMLDIDGVYKDYKEAFDAEIGVLDMVRASVHTAEIAAQDDIRDKAYYALVTALKLAGQTLTELEDVKAIHNLELVLNSYGNIARKTYDQETAAIDDLMRELEANYLADVVQLKLQDRLVALANENQKFKVLMTKRYEETSEKPNLRMRTARQITDTLYRAILNFIEAKIVVHKGKEFMDLSKALNAVAKRHKDLLAQKKGKNNNIPTLNN